MILPTIIVNVYILKLQNNTYYTGITKNLNRRMNEHESGKSKSTRKFLPCQLVYFAECEGYRNARKQEKYIKNKGAFHFLLGMRFRK